MTEVLEANAHAPSNSSSKYCAVQNEYHIHHIRRVWRERRNQCFWWGKNTSHSTQGVTRLGFGGAVFALGGGRLRELDQHPCPRS